MNLSQAGRIGGFNNAKKRKAEALANYLANPNKCLFCQSNIPVKGRIADTRAKKFCDSSCTASFNNRKREHKITPCRNCQKPTNKLNAIYCSQQCQHRYQYNEYIKSWKTGLDDGVRSDGLDICKHIRRYLFEKLGPQCWKCGWSEINPITGKVPLNINHIDGNPINNQETNLELICPNCHSLTPNYGGLNRGNGRKTRYRPKTKSFSQKRT